MLAEPTPNGAPASPLRALLSLAWPIVLARATQAVVGFCDALMVAPLGEKALAAATTGSLDFFCVLILPLGTAFILQSFAAQLRGRGELAALPRYGAYGLGLGLVSGVLALALIPGVRPALGLLDVGPEVHGMMSSYLSIRLGSMFAAVTVEALGSWFGGIGNTRPSMVAGVITMLVNVALNYLLIEPRFGLPGYGTDGAAWASFSASWVGCAVVLLLFLREIGRERLRDAFRVRRREFLRVLRFGLPNGVNWFLEFGAFILFINVVIGHLGTHTLAAFNVVMQINSLAFMPAFGVTSAGAILVGEAIGRGKKDEVWPLVKLTGKISGLWMGTVGLTYLIAPRALIGLFEADGAAGSLSKIGVTMLVFSAFWQLFDAANMTLSEALRAAGDTTWCMFARLIVAWLLFTPLAWTAVFAFEGGVITVMSSLVAYLALLSGLFAWRFASGRWRDIDLVEKSPELVPQP